MTTAAIRTKANRETQPNTLHIRFALGWSSVSMANDGGERRGLAAPEQAIHTDLNGWPPSAPPLLAIIPLCDVIIGRAQINTHAIQKRGQAIHHLVEVSDVDVPNL